MVGRYQSGDGGLILPRRAVLLQFVVRLLIMSWKLQFFLAILLCNTYLYLATNVLGMFGLFAMRIRNRMTERLWTFGF